MNGYKVVTLILGCSQGQPFLLLLDHYDFYKSITLAWLDPKLDWKKSNKRSADNNINVYVRQQGQGGYSSSNAEGGSTQTTRASSNKKQKRAPPVTDDSLCLQTGALRHRLEVHHGEHLPTLQSTKGAKCALHNWEGEKQTRSHILKCETCCVYLCIECFTLFHTLEEPTSLKTCVKAHEMAQEQQQVMVNATNGIEEVQRTVVSIKNKNET